LNKTQEVTELLREAEKVLQKYFGYPGFRDGQAKIITSVLEGTDTFAIMPTGAGKSICYQVPALLLPGMTVVVSPLISLMKDQVDSLKELGIAADLINSSLTKRELDRRLENLAAGDYRILYVAPERLDSEEFLDMIVNLDISLLAIDEAHCVSQWGHDFRKSYRLIPKFVKRLPHRPILAAFTATATEEVKTDIIKLLDLRQPNIYVTGFDRPNLSFSVLRGVNKPQFLLDYLTGHPSDSGIIYAATRKEVDKVIRY
jgi:ATP-dependent DNA helicase RecQ